MQDEVERIAAGLTEAQRRAIIDATDRMSNHRGFPFFTVEFQPKQAWPGGIAEMLTLTTDRLTPLGLRVRAHLQEQTP